MDASQKARRTILHFGTDRVILLLRARDLKEVGYHVLNSSDGFETIRLAAEQPVDVVVLDLDRNSAEVTLVAKEVKRCRPRLPTIVVADGPVPMGAVHELADALVPKRDDLEMLVSALENVLTKTGA